MTFVLEQLNPIGGQSRPRKSVPQGSPTASGPALWSYFHASDNLAAVKTAGYFNSVRKLLSAGDVIFLSAKGAAVDVITVNAVPATGNVTVQTADINSA